MSWYLYIAQARTGNYYVGITTEPARRIRDHNKGKGSRMAMAQGPFKLVYTSKPLPDQSTARQLEMQVKRWPRQKKEKLINNPSVHLRRVVYRFSLNSSHVGFQPLQWWDISQ